mgnify:CR=1 FL=1
MTNYLILVVEANVAKMISATSNLLPYRHINNPKLET